jgi:hypothetical protein
MNGWLSGSLSTQKMERDSQGTTLPSTTVLTSRAGIVPKQERA